MPLKTFVPAQKPNLLNGNHLLGVCMAEKILGLPQNVHQFLVCPEKFGQAPNILGPVEERGISM